MVRTDIVHNGWLCKECYHKEDTFTSITDVEDFMLRVGAEDF